MHQQMPTKVFKILQNNSTGPHTLSQPWLYQIVSAGSEVHGCTTKIVEPDQQGNGEVGFLADI